MKSATAVISTLAAAGAVALGASPAFGSSYTLQLSAPPTVGAGQPTIIQASGANPPDDFFSSWLDISAIPASVLGACPADYLNANQIARTTYAQGGEVVINSQRENVDAAGSFSMPIAYTPTTPGRFLICGYTNDGATTTLATSSLVIDVQGATAPPPPPTPTPHPPSTGAPATVAKPANSRKPRVRRSGRRLTCNRGSWSNAPTRYRYSWLVNGRRKRGATGRRLAVTRKVRGRRVQCRVKATNAGGTATAVSRRVRVR